MGWPKFKAPPPGPMPSGKRQRADRKEREAEMTRRLEAEQKALEAKERREGRS